MTLGVRDRTLAVLARGGAGEAPRSSSGSATGGVEALHTLMAVAIQVLTPMQRIRCTLALYPVFPGDMLRFISAMELRYPENSP